MKVLLWMLVALTTGCIAPQYRVQRSARVPHATSPLYTGQPVAGVAELSLAGSTVGDIVEPEKGPSTAALEIPKQQIRADLRVRVGARGELGIIHERGLGEAAKLDPTQAPIPDGNPTGSGAALRYSAPVTDKWSIGLATEIIVWSIPWVEYRTCVADCGGAPLQETQRGSATIGSFGVGVTPSYRAGAFVAFGGLFARTHPTIERKGMEYGNYDDDDVSSGPFNILVQAGVGYQVSREVGFLARFEQNLSRDPVRYGPTVGLALSLTLFDP
jgi:hypothetical protein